MARSNVVGTPDVNVNHLKGLGTVVNDAQPQTKEEIIILTSLEERPAATTQNNEQPPAEPAEPARRYPQKERRHPKHCTPESGDLYMLGYMFKV